MEKGHPTLDGKRYITQMIVGGMTQFLTKAQGMPKNIEAALIKIIRNFIWDNTKSPPINLEQLYRPQEEGGINLLDIKARNEAIEITWVRDYLNLSQMRPAWAFIMDIILNEASNTNITKPTNLFLQSWEPPTRGQKAKALPREALSLIKTAKNFNITFAPIKISKEIKKQLPAWHHLGAPRKTYHKIRDQCLYEMHNSSKSKI